MPIDKSVIGKPTGTSRVVIERSPVSNFASAVKDPSPEYRDPRAAAAAGFSAMPVPPTYPFAMEYWGKFDEIQPDDPGENAMFEALSMLRGQGGLLLHGEQEFIYHRPMVVGDVLVGKGRISDIYEKESKGKTMTFIVTETVWSDDSSGEPVVTSRFNLIHRV
ncbi:MAG: MaoC family dehydratase N-terminal domain-containing protein [Acidimicrobiales bacterium]